MGEFKDGERVYGVHSYQRLEGLIGEKYIGPIVEGKFHGKGTYLFADGRRYVGEFVYGKFEGQGVMYYRGDDPDFLRYEGEFADDVFSGTGTLHYIDGRRFEGTFQNGEQHDGILLDTDGTQRKIRSGRPVE